MNQRHYQALRAYFTEGLTYEQACTRFGYTRWAMIDLVRQHRAGKLELYAPPRKPGPPPGTAPPSTRPAAGRSSCAAGPVGVSDLPAPGRRGTPLNRTSVGEILAEEGFGLLLRRPEPRLASPRRQRAGTRTCPRRKSSTSAPGPAGWNHPGSCCCHPRPGVPVPARPGQRGRYPGTPVLPAICSLLSLLALKLTRTRRVSHVDDLMADPAAALFAGLAVLPKKTALTEYSYRLSHTTSSGSWLPWTSR